MKKDQFQDKYEELLQEMKKEKMDWDFQDFIQRTKVNSAGNSAPVIPIRKANVSLIKIIGIAASLVIVLGIALFWKSNNSPKIEENNTLVKNNILQQKNTIIADSGLAYQDPQDSLSKGNAMMHDTLSVAVSDPEKVMDQIVSKKSRLKKSKKIQYASHDADQDQPVYEDNFVIVNGHKIMNEQEAINVTKYSFQILSDNVTKTIASSVVQDNPID